MRVSATPQHALGRAILLRRLELMLTQEQLAAATGLTPRTIRGIEHGITNPTWHTADTIARGLGLSLAELARRTEELEIKDRRPTNEPLRPPD